MYFVSAIIQRMFWLRVCTQTGGSSFMRSFSLGLGPKREGVTNNTGTHEWRVEKVLWVVEHLFIVLFSVSQLTLILLQSAVRNERVSTVQGVHFSFRINAKNFTIHTKSHVRVLSKTKSCSLHIKLGCKSTCSKGHAVTLAVRAHLVLRSTFSLFSLLLSPSLSLWSSCRSSSRDVRSDSWGREYNVLIRYL